MCLPGRVFDVFREQQLPSAIIIGTRKGGTAALCEILATHPQVKKASNELHFFDDDSNFALGSNWLVLNSKRAVATTERVLLAE